MTIASEMAVAASGKTPKEVLLDNMRFFDQQAAQLLQQIVAKTTKPGVDLGADLGEMIKFRQMAVECAQKVAPYCHPRLNAVMVADERSGLVSADGRRLEDLAPEQLRAEILAEMGELGLLPENPHSVETDARSDAGSGLILAYPTPQARLVPRNG